MIATAGPIIIREGGGNAALVVAIVGLVLAVFSLAWQAFSFFLSGPRLKVTVEEGLRGAFGQVLRGSLAAYTDDTLANLLAQGYEEVLTVRVENTGRLAATVNGWSITFGNQVAYEHPADMWNPTLPHRLEPHTDAIWCASLENLRGLQAAFEDQSDDAARARAVVRPAAGPVIESKWTAPIRRAGEAE